MTLSPNLLLAVSLAYVAVLFAVAWVVDRRAREGRAAWLRSPLIYTLSISIYCTSWTFYGAVGSAARSGLEFVTIYLGPTLVFVGWWWILRKLVTLGRSQRITSIADLISSRYGKSPALGGVVTVIAIIATTPYIALQLQSVTLSFEAIAGQGHSERTAFWVAAGMAVFTIIFGTRNIDANERHHGVVAAIALEAIVKLGALLAVGVFAVWGLGGGILAVFDRMPEDLIVAEEVFGPRWMTLTFLAATAILCLPRQFQVTVVENVDQRHLITASWMFPLYLLLISLFTLPIAVMGLTLLPAESNPDLYVLNLPLQAGREELALLVFIGGFSSATSMVIVATIALSTMVSNHIVAPMALKVLMTGNAASGDVRDLLLGARRVSIAVILGLGLLYFLISGGSDALAAMGLIAFAGVAQFLPAMLGGIFWRGATRAGALSGLTIGGLLWAYTLFLPSFQGDFLLSAGVLENGPWGIAILKPQALFGLTGTDPLIHSVVWSVGGNALAFVLVSLFTIPRPLEQLQAALFVDPDVAPTEAYRVFRREASSEDLFILAQRILGADSARRLFDQLARERGVTEGLPEPDNALIARLERELAGSIGAASAHAMVSKVAGGETVSLTELMEIADEAQRLIETSARLAQKTTELERTADELRSVNDRLRRLDKQKDDFLSQVSHELRTPMTAIRSFSEILLSEPGLAEDQRHRFASIIHEECLRLTRLLDEILDISRLESGEVRLTLGSVDAGDAVDAAMDTVSALARERGVTLKAVQAPGETAVTANADRLQQVLINLLTNAIKYNRHPAPEIALRWHERGDRILVDVVDNGGGVSRAEAEDVFSKFARGSRAGSDQGAGLGLPISRAIMRRMGGELMVVFKEDGTSFFRLVLVRSASAIAGAAE
ncbi:MAG: sensor histidine kinase [Pseudomonadota bacterium]